MTISTSGRGAKMVELTEAGLELLAEQDTVYIATEEELLRPLNS